VGWVINFPDPEYPSVYWERRSRASTGRRQDAVRDSSSRATPAVDGLVLGHRGLSEYAEQRMGSVAKDMLGRSPVPVTVVS